VRRRSRPDPLPSPPPPWLTAELHSALGAFDLGDAPRVVRYRPGDAYPYGANTSFRIAVAQAHGGFSTQVGMIGRRNFLHEETDLCYRIDHAGGEIRYAPDAIVDHCVQAERLRPEWFLDRYALCGRSAAVYELRNRGLRRALGRVRWYYGAHLAVRPYTPRPPVDPARLLAECRRREAVGYLAGLARGVGRLRALRRDVVARRLRAPVQLTARVES